MTLLHHKTFAQISRLLTSGMKWQHAGNKTKLQINIAKSMESVINQLLSCMNKYSKLLLIISLLQCCPGGYKL